VALRAGPLSAQVAPSAFWTQNREFELMATGQKGASVYADPLSPLRIDLPQRFGDEAYGRVDPGESFVRLDVGRLAAGVSTAAQVWGPAQHQPLVLGNNAGGFPHLFLESNSPVNVGIGRVHGRVFYGDLAQSGYSPVPAGPGSRRFFSGMAAVFTPAFLPGVELGAARVFQVAWPEGGLDVGNFTKIFEPFTKASLPDADSSGSRASPDNQLASVFARWVLPGAGLEVYGEFAREDHGWDLLDVSLEPDHQSALSLGFRRAWGREVVWVLHGELANTVASHLETVRKQPPFYSHLGTRQGHTHRGQLLAAPFGHTGGGSVVGVDRYGPRGRASLRWVRGRMGQRWRYAQAGEADADGTSVVHALSADGVLMRRRLDVTWSVGAAAELNRHFADDAFNLGASVGVRMPL
jgi:hypothetical protein